MKIGSFVKQLGMNWNHPKRMIKAYFCRYSGQESEKSVSLHNGESMTVVLPDQISHDLFLGIRCEPDVNHFLEQTLEHGSTFIDGGAHMGYITLLANSIVGSKGTIHSFEPIEDVRSILIENTKPYGNINVHKEALREISEPLDLKFYGMRWAGQTTSKTVRLKKKQREKLTKPIMHRVPGITLDDFVEKSGVVPTTIKLDVGGEEYDVLKGSEHTIAAYHPNFIVEVGDYEGAVKSADSIKLLEHHGYRFFTFKRGMKNHTPQEKYGYGNILAVYD